MTTPNDERRVIQCACGASSPYRGDALAYEDGWGHPRSAAGEVIPGWVCSECRTRDAAPALKRPGLPSYLRTLIGDGQRTVSLEQLELVRAQDPTTFAAYVDEILYEAEISKTLREKGKKGLWSMLAKKYGRYGSGRPVEPAA